MLALGTMMTNYRQLRFRLSLVLQSSTSEGYLALDQIHFRKVVVQQTYHRRVSMYSIQYKTIMFLWVYNL